MPRSQLFQIPYLFTGETSYNIFLFYFKKNSILLLLFTNPQHLLILHKQTIFVLSFASVIDSMAAF
jgi:hypothetical protein